MDDTIYCVNPACKKPFENEYEYCPYCGQNQSFQAKSSSQQINANNIKPLISFGNSKVLYLVVSLAAFFIFMLGIVLGHFLVSKPHEQEPNFSPGTSSSMPAKPTVETRSSSYQAPQTNQTEEDLRKLDQLVGDYNSCLRRIDDAAQRLDADFKHMDDMKRPGQDFDEFYNASSRALELYPTITSNPLFKGNYRESLSLSNSAQGRYQVDRAANIRNAASLRYLERR